MKLKDIQLKGRRDPVAKNMNRFNKAATFRDRKNDYKRKEKHAKRHIEEEIQLTKAEGED